MKETLFGLLSVILMASCLQFEAKETADLLKLESFELANGLKVFVSTNREQAEVHAQVVVRSGSRHDPIHATGLAHYLEHMLFKGTDKIGTIDYPREKVILDQITVLYQKHLLSQDPEERKIIMAEISRQSTLASQLSIPNDYDRLTQAIGARNVNAFTSNDETCYHSDIPSQNFSLWAKLEAERFMNPVFRLFQTELEAVYEEKNGSLDSRQSAAFEPLMNTLFPHHPYGTQTTLGKTEHLKSPSLQYMYQFYRDWYVPSNMAIILSGDIDADEAKDVLEKTFGAWVTKKTPELLLPLEASLDQEKRIYVNFPSEQLVLLGYRLPPANHRDIAGLKVLDMLLDNGETGVFNRRLNQTQAVLKAGCTPMLMHDHGLHYMYVYPKDGQSPEEALALLDGQLNNLIEGGFDMDDAEAVINDLERHREEELESNKSRAAIIRECFTRGISLATWQNEIDRMRNYSHSDLEELANKYYKRGRAVVIREEGYQEIERLEKPSLGEVLAPSTELSAFSENLIKQAKFGNDKAFFDPQKDLTHESLTSGSQLSFNQNKVNRLATLELFIPKGFRHERRLNQVAAILKESGCDGDDLAERKELYYRKGIKIDIRVKATKTLLSLSCLEDDMPEALELFMEHMQEPEISVDLVNQWARKSRLLRANAKKDTEFLNDALVEFARYGEQSRYVQAPSDESIAKLKVEDIEAIWQDLLNCEAHWIYTANKKGQIPELIKKLWKRSDVYKAPVVANKTIQNRDRDSVLFYHSPGVQAYLSVNFSPAQFVDSDKSALVSLYNEYFDGSLGSVVFQEIREKRSLAYSAYANYYSIDMKGADCLFSARIDCQADKTKEALNVMKEIINRPPINKQRIEMAKQAVLSRLLTRRPSMRERPESYFRWLQSAWQGRNPKPFFIRALKNTKLEDIEHLIEKELRNVPLTITVMGDQSAIDLTALRRQAHLRYVHIDELFSY